MRKFMGLFSNEMTKIVTKISVRILLIIMVIATLAFGGILKISYNAMSENQWSYYDSEYYLDDMGYTVTSLENELENTQKSMNEDITEGEKLSLQQSASYYKYQIEMYKIAIENKDNINSSSWLSELYNNIANKKSEYELQTLINPDNVANNENLTELQKSITELETIRNNKNYSAYLDFKDKEIENNYSYSKEEKDIYLQETQLLRKVNPTGEMSEVTDNNAQKITQLTNVKLNLLNNMDTSSNAPLTEDKREDLQNRIAVIEYKLNNGIDTSSSSMQATLSSAVSSMVGVGIFFLSIMLIMVAGATISSEISTGSIKSLIISPMRRGKIYTAKFLAIVVFTLISLLILYIAVIVSNMIFFGSETVVPFITASHGVAKEVNFYVYNFLILLVKGIDVLAFSIFALMLSTITRNTSVSVSVSVAALFAQSVAMVVIQQLFSGEWTKFIPYANIGLETKFFPTYGDSSWLSLVGSGASTSLRFSLIYLLVAFICMLYIGYDSFVRRDIK